MAARGDTFLGAGEIHGEDHLWIVINDPTLHDDTALIVNVSSLRPGADTSCVLRRGDHPFIRHDSYVRFRSAKKTRVEDLETLIASRRLHPQEQADAALVQRIRAGAFASPEFPDELLPLL